MKANVMIGSRSVIFNERLIVPDGETARFSVLIERTLLSFEVCFLINAPSKTPVEWAVTEGVLRMTFSAPPGTFGPLVLKTPARLGVIDGHPIGFTFELLAQHGSHVLQLIVMKGGNYDE
ncbi:MAG: hypothetical protein ACYC0T_11435 [Ramlibacter sp.]